ncbi:kelch repeat-containing protein [Paraflavisolibacter sp. H34]|uniref:kelch repeat-containing protein n=1 Tax=Huijunlia imazamoxiresistens TaxID=3127457 RepID=UPI003019A9BD
MKNFTRCSCSQAVLPALLLLWLTLCGGGEVFSQATGSFWSDRPAGAAAPRAQRGAAPQKYRALSLNVPGMRTLLAGAPKEQAASLRTSTSVVNLPLPDGRSARFRFTETSVMAPELAARFPGIRSYTGVGVDDPRLTAAFDFTPAGFHGMIHSPEQGLSFIDPFSPGDTGNYMAYAKKDYTAPPEKAFYEPTVLGTETENAKRILQLAEQRRALRTDALLQGSAGRPSGDKLRTYRIAIAATGEYTAFHGGTVGDALAAINTTLNRVNFIYIREVAIRMVLVAKETSIIYTSSTNDPYSNGIPSSMITQVQSDIDSKIGNAHYDIGHVFGTNSGGLASLGVVSQAGLKARGVTGSGAPVGDAFDVDYVAHEIGHQFGAYHTFNGNAGACYGNRIPGSAYEPGSGSTIMGYAGICGAQDLQPTSDAYFHVISYDQIFAYTQLGPGSANAVVTNSGNTAPVPQIVTPNNLTIPRQTPFVITGRATDAQNDPITYCWEQYDLGPAGSPTAPSENAPVFRSFTGTGSPSRTFPRLPDLLNNSTSIGEQLPSYTRALHFNLTVRDNFAGGGGLDWIYPLTVNVTAAAGPFVVTTPNTAMTLKGGEEQAVSWNVAGTNREPVGAATVNILLSTDGGQTFPYLLAAATPNDGQQTVILPNILTSTARIRVEAAENIFFDISNVNFKIEPSAGPTITSVTPSSGPAGTGVVIRGSNLVDVTAIRFNGVAAAVTYIPNASLAYATVPQGAGIGPVQVVAEAGTATAPSPFTVTAFSSAWTERAPMATPRAQHGALAANGKIYVFGGINGSGPLGSLEIYDPLTNKWSAGAPMPAPSRGMAFALGSNGMIYAFSGFSDSAITKAYSYNPANNTWTVLATMPGGVWEGAAATAADGKVYVFGGEPSGAASANATRIYDISTNKWSTGAHMPKGLLQHSAITGDDGRIYIFGGRAASGGAPLDLLQIYNPATNSWSAGRTMPYPKTQFAAVKAGNGAIYIIGGKADYLNSQGPFFHTVEVYTPATNSWAAGPELPVPAGELEAVNAGGNLYVLGGSDGTQRNYNFLLQLMPSLTGFSPAAAGAGAGVAISGANLENVTAVRFNGVAAAGFEVAGPGLVYATVPEGATTGRIELVIGGRSVWTTAAFKVAAIKSSWKGGRALTHARSGHGAVAANGRIYVFGGRGAGGLLDSLEVFDPALNTWKGGAPLPAATSGMAFAADSLGLIYVFGGTASSSASYRYHPAANSWSPLATLPGPVAEGAAAALGDKVYVFGGAWGGSVSNATRIYHTATDTWSTGAHMPKGLLQHSAVAGADGRIYIFGGRPAPGQAPSPAVYIYTPATDSWTTGAAMPVPKVQFGAVQAADGRIYIVGGRGGLEQEPGTLFHTVDVYAPATDSWTAGPVLPLPAGGQVAVNIRGNLYALGGADSTQRNDQYLLPLAPALTSFTPASGAAGTAVAVKGARFAQVTSVTFNGVPAAGFYVAGTSLLYATVPAGAQRGKIEVVTRNGTVQSAASFTETDGASLWITRTGLGAPRSGHGAVAANGRIYVFGGRDSTGPLRSLEVFDPALNTWKGGAPLPAATSGMAFAADSLGLIYVFGGTAAPSATYRYHPAANRWSPLAPLPVPVVEGAAAALGDKIYVFGGEGTGGSASNATRIYHPAANTWSAGAPMPKSLLQHSAVAGADGHIYIFGGRISATGGPLSSVYIYTPATDSWATGTAMPVPKAQFGAVQAADGRIYVVGGRAVGDTGRGPLFHTVDVYTPATNRWAAGPVLPAPAGQQVAVSLHDDLYAVGGADSTRRNYNFQLVLPPLAPAGLTATVASTSRIALKWVDKAKNAAAYVVERAAAPAGPFSVLSSALAASSRSYASTGLAAGTTYYYRVKATNGAGSSAYSNVTSATTSGGLSLPAPTEAEVQQAPPPAGLSVYPNPAGPQTRIRFTVAEDQAQVRLGVYDLQGRLVEELYRGPARAGQVYGFEWQTARQAAGVYFARLVSAGGVWQQQIILTPRQ